MLCVEEGAHLWLQNLYYLVVLSWILKNVKFFFWSFKKDAKAVCSRVGISHFKDQDAS